MVGIPENVFWGLTPKTIQVYFRAYKKKREIAIQDIWLQGSYVRQAIISSLSFSDKNPPDYPEMPFAENAEEELAQDEKWAEAQRARLYSYFSEILSKHKDKTKQGE